MKTTTLTQSTCCHAPVIVAGGKTQEEEPLQTTYWYECTACRQPCDVLAKQKPLYKVEHLHDLRERVITRIRTPRMLRDSENTDVGRVVSAPDINVGTQVREYLLAEPEKQKGGLIWNG
jgi:hypothetical protein